MEYEEKKIANKPKPYLTNPLKGLIDLLSKYTKNIAIVGGAVRDFLENIKPKDYDIVSDIKPEDMIKILSDNNIKYIDIGSKYGTIIAVFQGENFEITTLREDLICDGRYSKVEYSSDFLKDSMRRDFTINAIYYFPLTQKFLDFHEGISDLNNKIVKFIGNAEDRIQEDYLRIIRYIRFTSKYSKNIDEENILICKKYLDKIKSLSIERIYDEFSKIFSQKKNLELCLIILQKLDIFNVFQLKVEIDFYSIYFEKNFLSNYQKIFKNNIDSEKEIKIFQKLRSKITADNYFCIRFFLLFRNYSDKKLEEILRFFKLPKRRIAIIKKLSNFYFQILSNCDYEILLYKFWFENKDEFYLFLIIFAIFKHDTDISFNFGEILDKYFKNSDLAKMPNIVPKLSKLGYGGENLGKILNIAKEKWILSKFELTRDKLMYEIKNFL